MFDAMYKHYAVILHKYFHVAYKFKISWPIYLFLCCLFLTKKQVYGNGIYGNGREFLL